MNVRYSPTLAPKTRTMTKAKWKLLDHLVRKSYRDNKDKIRRALRDQLMYGTAYLFPNY